MYLPSSFQEARIDVLHALMRANPLATLVTVNGSVPDVPELVADHVPLQTLATPAPFGSLRGHIARANPLWRVHDPGREVLCVFQGPQVYISPSLYPSKQESGKVVPTWDYAVVHAHGTLRFIHDAAWLLALVTELTDVQESRRSTPWKVDDAPPSYVSGMLAAIVGFELTITRLSGKWKVSQNRAAADRRGVVDGLRATGDPQSRDIADMLAAREPDAPIAG